MMSMYSVATVFLVLAAAYTWALPDFCEDHACPSFSAAYELRNYGQSSWVATSVTSSTTNPSTYGMFMKLFRYINGTNAADQKIAMTAPVLKKVETLPSGQYELTMMFYLTQATPPQPTESGVFLMTRPSGDVYVRVFNQMSRAEESDYNSHLDALRTAIGDTTQYNGNIYYKAGYNSPFYTGMRHDEVWLDRLTS